MFEVTLCGAVIHCTNVRETGVISSRPTSLALVSFPPAYPAALHTFQSNGSHVVGISRDLIDFHACHSQSGQVIFSV